MEAMLSKHRSGEYGVYLLKSQTWLFVNQKGISTYQRKKQLQKKVDQLNNLHSIENISRGMKWESQQTR